MFAVFFFLAVRCSLWPLFVCVTLTHLLTLVCSMFYDAMCNSKAKKFNTNITFKGSSDFAFPLLSVEYSICRLMFSLFMLIASFTIS